MSVVWTKLLRQPSDGGALKELGSPSKIRDLRQDADIDDLCQALTKDDSPFDIEANPSQLQVYNNETNVGDSSRALRPGKKLSELIEGNSYNNPLIIVAPLPPGK